jgi:Fur family ferric uptake transcriptional regulator
MSRRSSASLPGRVRYSTRQGADVRDAMTQIEGFKTAQQVHEFLRAAGSKIGLATVYRHLAEMAEEGEVDSLRNPNGETVFRRCGAESHHHHLVCRSCGKTLEFEGPEVEAWAERVAKRARFVEVSHSVEVFGTCSDCARRT